MSINRTVHTAWTSYATMACTVVTALLTMRLATGALTREEFGLWSFTTQSVGYFLLLDFGVSNSLGRLFGEPLASGDQRSINSWFTLSVSVLALQGIIILVVGMILRAWVLEWFNIPLVLRPEASKLWLAFLVIQALNFPLRVTSAILYAQNRAYLSNLFPLVTAWISLILFYWMLKNDAGVMAYAWSSGVGVLLGGLAGLIAMYLGPDRFRFSLAGVTWMQIKELFTFSFSVFAVSIAVQVVFSSQALIITKMLGLGAGAIYNVTSRLPLLAMQMLWRPFDAFCPRWQSAHCDGLDQKITAEFRIMARISFLCSMVAAVGLILVNPIFVTGWAKGEYFGGSALNGLFGLFVIMQTLGHCYSFGFVLHKKMRIYTQVVCISTVMAICLMILGVKWLGLAGIPAGLLATDLLLGVWFYVIKGGALIGVKAGRTTLSDLALGAGPVGAALMLAFAWKDRLPTNLWFQFILSSAVALILVSPILWRIWKMASLLRLKKSSHAPQVSHA